ncbi:MULTISPECIES: galactosyltransferase-related protein [Cryobacterium]|uniref:glycosyltransferase family 2 protein n=1 Tax=Cryobacterium TaxID=69578 RepID=UPI001F542E8B|nr:MULTISPECIES: galactosyltransferase-related protein [Cryobacterium]
MIVTVSNRRAHLVNQHRALGNSETSPDGYVVVAMNEPDVNAWLPSTAPEAQIVNVHTSPGRLPLATARNLGAHHAIEQGAELLVFLDVDCVPSASLLSAYASAARLHPEAILSGAVGYLPEGTDVWGTGRAADAHFHDFRPRLLPGETAPADPSLFWSLSFAVTTPVWQRVGGFCEEYVGYGAEDTDFARLASRAGTPFRWVGGAEAFHQYHSIESPPIRHLEDILRNGRLFASRWGFWPMTGWLEAFQVRGLVTFDEATGDWLKVRECS